jgi:hypothetical protein
MLLDPVALGLPEPPLLLQPVAGRRLFIPRWRCNSAIRACNAISAALRASCPSRSVMRLPFEGWASVRASVGCARALLSGFWPATSSLWMSQRPIPLSSHCNHAITPHLPLIIATRPTPIQERPLDLLNVAV